MFPGMIGTSTSLAVVSPSSSVSCGDKPLQALYRQILRSEEKRKPDLWHLIVGWRGQEPRCPDEALGWTDREARVPTHQ